MKVLLVLFLAALTSAIRFNGPYSIEKVEDYFEEFIKTFDKVYTNEVEKAKKFAIFKNNLEVVIQKNSESKSDIYGITKFSDLTREEFIATYTGLRNSMQEASGCKAGTSKNSSAPDSYSWKDKGVISKAKDQGICGSCWAFGAIGNIEAQYAIKKKKMLDLSEQQLVDCDKSSHGCDGTNEIYYPFLYLKKSGAMEEKDYAYKGLDGECKFDGSKVKVTVDDCIEYTTKSEDELKEVVFSTGPLAIGVDAIDMQLYSKGVLKNCECIELNHVVLVVGYGTENDTPYWLIKNSWGEKYGEDGFIKVERGVNACGMMNMNKYGSVVS